MKSILSLIFPIFFSLTIFFSIYSADGFPAPLKQFESGVLPQNIICNENFVLIYKSSDNSPRCVKESTALILESRGFSFELISKKIFEPKAFQQTALDSERCTNKDFPINWSNCDLYGRVLSNIDLRYANLEGANLSGVTLNNKNLTGINFSNSSLKNGDLDGSDLTNTNFSYASLIDTKVRNAILTNATFKNANLLRADFTGSNLTNADLSYSTLTKAILSFVDLKNTNLEGAGTWRTNLNHCINHEICK